MAEIKIDEPLASALITLLRLFKELPMAEIEQDLMRAVESSGAEVIIVPVAEAIEIVNKQFGSDGN